MAKLITGESGYHGSQPKLTNLQYLRAVAALLVVLFHVTNLTAQNHHYAYIYQVFSFGYMGVDLFFVISGFIICYIHYADFGLKSQLHTFFVKRFTRVFPVYWIVFLPVVLVHFILPSFGQGYERELAEIVQSMFLIPQNHHPILDVAWTLRHEMLFYVMFGLLFILNSSRVLFSVVWIGWIAMSTYSMVFKPQEPWLLYEYLFSPYNLEFILGCIIAAIVTKYPISLKWAWASLIFGIGIFVFSLINEYLTLVRINRIIAWGIPSSFIVLAAVALDRKLKVKVNKALKYMGDASYSIYLTHVPAYYFFMMIFSKLNLFLHFGNFSTVTLCIVMTMLSGCLFYLIVEKPVLRMLKKIFIKVPGETRGQRTPRIFSSS